MPRTHFVPSWDKIGAEWGYVHLHSIDPFHDCQASFPVWQLAQLMAA